MTPSETPKPERSVGGGHSPADSPAGLRRAQATVPWQGWLGALLVVALCTAVSELLLPYYTERATLITLYLVGVVYVALRLGQSAALLALVASIVAFDLLVVAPRWSLVPLDPQYYFTFMVMLVVGVLICRLVLIVIFVPQSLAAFLDKEKAIDLDKVELPMTERYEKDAAKAASAPR